ncbi:hypothetical protein AADZ91_05605 [Colwelliaceae bacterium 6441]
MINNVIVLTKKSSLVINILWLVLLLSTSGCQLTQAPVIDSQYSHYYLWLKSLSSDELLKEANQQQQNISNDYFDAEVNLALLYALPNSPIYNPYTAKTQLNQLAQDPEKAVHITSAEFGFIMMMKDQLNQQILALNKLVLTEQKYQEQTLKLTGKNTELDELMTKIKKLKQQIKQLKNIEFDITG